MSTIETVVQEQPHQPNHRGRGGHHGRNRNARNVEVNAGGQSGESSGGEGRRHRPRGGRNAALALRPAALPPSSQPNTTSSGTLSTTEANAVEQTSRRGRQRPGRGRSEAQRGQRMVNGRAFGGHLTSTSEDGSVILQAAAPEFVPGQPILPTAQSARQPINAPRRRRPSKSTAPDILTRTHEDIEHSQYECPICTSEVQRSSKVWSCHTCWTVFHLACIKKWASNEGSAAARRASAGSGDLPPPRQWRCPGCNLPKDELPKAYTCWCGKETDPRAPTGIPPHSCGNTCGKDRVRKCPHPCQLTCHAGPCPPCAYMGPPQSCFCGKHESTRRCVDTDYDNGYSCGEACGDIMPCGVHMCPRLCHEGLCGACEAIVDAKCYCGQVDQSIRCHDQSEPRRSIKRPNEDDTLEEEWYGTFACDNICDRTFDCQVHKCERPCHSTEASIAHCPRSVDVVTHCPCGKTPLSSILTTSRERCSDSIPSCDKACGKTLGCGHACEKTCHLGECPPCMKNIQISCVCGRVTTSTVCHQGQVEQPHCMRVCNSTLSCGRHACDERCCSGERKASERLGVRKKKRPLGSAAPPPDLIEPEHICTRVCGRPLKCGNHYCQELCHKGQCGSCREAIFDELPCHCGRTTLEPPLPCGTKPPPCRFQCERPKTCGHPQVQHTCHLDDESCPKCPFLVERRCLCGKKVLKNQQCWLQDVRCGQVCGRMLKCGSHFCRKPCHRPGECEDAGGQPCQQPCGKPKTVCGHPDENACHAPFSCKEDKACQSKIFITCDCQAIKQEARCGASKSSEGNLKKKLSCTEECARLERNRRLAVALNIDQSSHQDGGDHVPYSDDTLATYQRHSKWAQTQEREFRVFADSPEEKRLRFKPMPAAQRAFLHSLADDFGFDSESMDPEPHRHILLMKTPRFVSAPSKTIAEAVRIRMTKRDLLVKQPVAERTKANHQAESDKPFNALILISPRFGLTVDEIRAAVLTTREPSQPEFDISFLPSEEVVLRPRGDQTSDEATEQMLKDCKPALSGIMTTDNLGNLQLCALDSSLNILRRESDPSAADGWSRVAAKGAAPRKAPTTSAVGGPNAFSALSNSPGKVTFAKKKEKVKPVKIVEPVVDDWEAEMEAEERRSRAEASASSADEGQELTEISQVGATDAVIEASAASAEGSEERPAGVSQIDGA